MTAEQVEEDDDSVGAGGRGDDDDEDEEDESDIPAATTEDVELAVGAARKALARESIWASSSGAYRAKFLCAIAVKLKASDHSGGFDGVPVFQSDLLVFKKKKKRYSLIYFQKEDLEKELRSRVRGASVSQHIVVGSLEDVFRKMETSDESSGWGDWQSQRQHKGRNTSSYANNPGVSPYAKSCQGAVATYTRLVPCIKRKYDYGTIIFLPFSC